MARTITGSNTVNVTLASGDNPVSITGTIGTNTGDALYGGPGTTWSITNSGHITTAGSDGHGVKISTGTVVNQAGGTISSSNANSPGGESEAEAVLVLSGPGHIDNFGLLTNSATVNLGAAVAELDQLGTITNEVGGTIAGRLAGAEIGGNGPQAVINKGLITGAGGATGYGVATWGGLVTNAAGGVITNWFEGVDFFFNRGSVENAGTISSTNGVLLQVGGSVTNFAGGVITGTGGAGIYSNVGNVTVDNAGTIAGTSTGSVTGAIHLATDPLNRVIDRVGAVFVGAVNGGTGMLELAAGVTASSFGTGFTNFAAVAFDAGAEKLSGSAAGLNRLAVTGFVKGNTIEITGGSDETITTLTNGTLELSGSAGTVDLLVGGGFTQSDYHVTASGGNTELTVACFCAGTRILTDAGEVPVEELRPSAFLVSALHHRLLPVRWIGVQQIDCARQPQARPVRIAAGAFGPGMPHRDLWLSPDHAVLVDEVLVPVRYLVNGSTIVQAGAGSVSYYHVELAAHGALLANGLAAETYRDTGNRSLFADSVAPETGSVFTNVLALR
jgi:collagen type I alpha